MLPEYLNSNHLLISPNCLKSLGVVGKNAHDSELNPIVKLTQDKILNNLLGTALYEQLLYLSSTKDENGTLLICLEENECYEKLLNGYVKHILEHAVCAEYIRRNWVKIRNVIARPTDNNFQLLSHQDMKKVYHDFYDDADMYIARLQKYLDCSCSCFPELRGHNYKGYTLPDRKNVTNSLIYFENEYNGCC